MNASSLCRPIADSPLIARPISMRRWQTHDGSGNCLTPADSKLCRSLRQRRCKLASFARDGLGCPNHIMHTGGLWLSVLRWDRMCNKHKVAMGNTRVVSRQHTSFYHRRPPELEAVSPSLLNPSPTTAYRARVQSVRLVNCLLVSQPYT